MTTFSAEDMDSSNIATVEDVMRLRSDATRTVMDVVTDVSNNYISTQEFTNFKTDLESYLTNLKNDNNAILNEIAKISARINSTNERNNEDILPVPTGEATPRPVNIETRSVTTQHDLDNDVIMRNTFPMFPNQVPEPGLFTGKTTDTDLFCQLCEDTFKSYPNNRLPEDFRINFVKSRLRDGARSWFLTKYKDIGPATMIELLNEIRRWFSDNSSVKLAKIQLVKLKHNYGKINEYIDQFRSLTRSFAWNEEALTLFFYNGLHAKFQEEIDKMEEFPTTLESIITKCILFENALDSKAKLKNNNSSNNNKNFKKKNSNYNYNNNNSYNKNYKNNNNGYNKNNNFNNKNQNNSKN